MTRLSAPSRLWDMFLTIQFLLYFIGISFSTGGGNYPGLSSNQFFYLKGMLILVPMIGLAIHMIKNNAAVLRHIGDLAYQNRFLLFYAVFAFISVPLAVDPSYSLQRLLFMLVGLGGIFSLILQFKRMGGDDISSYDRLARLILFLTGVAVIFPLAVLLRYGAHDLIPGYRRALQSYLLIHPNLLASFYAHLALFHAGYILYSNHKKLWLHKAGFAVLCCLIVLLFSRAVFLSAGITGLALSLIVFTASHKKTYVIAPLVCLAFVMVGLMLWLSGTTDAQSAFGFLTRGDNVDSLLTMTNRTELWRILLERLTVKTFFLGNGFSVVTETFGIDFGTGILYGAHNAYLSVFLGTGILSLLCLLRYFGGCFVTALRQRLRLPLFTVFITCGSLMLFALNCLVAEEMGVNMTVTCAYVILIVNIFLMGRSFEYPADRL